MKKNNRKIIFFINTTVFGEIFLALSCDGKIIKQKSLEKSEKLLSLISKLLETKKIKAGDLGGIVVVVGPGSFTAVRQGVVTANAIGYLLSIPVAGVRLDEFESVQEMILVGSKKLKDSKTGKIVLPFYGKEPNITKPKDPSTGSG